MLTRLFIVTISVFILNIPFGYWRANVKKFSFQWMLAVHIPVLFAITLRILLSLGIAWYTFVLFVCAFFLGQLYGALIHKEKKKQGKQTSSCLVMDIINSYSDK